MKRLLVVVVSLLLAGLAACAAVVEAVLVWLWLRGTLYVMRYGAAENPYAAEDAELAGLGAVMFLPLLLLVLACGGCWMSWRKKRAKPHSKR